MYVSSIQAVDIPLRSSSSKDQDCPFFTYVVLQVPLPVVRARGAMTISSDLVDAHLYVFNRWVVFDRLGCPRSHYMPLASILNYDGERGRLSLGSLDLPMST